MSRKLRLPMSTKEVNILRSKAKAAETSRKRSVVSEYLSNKCCNYKSVMVFSSMLTVEDSVAW